MDTKIFAAIIGLFIGAMLNGFGFLYRERCIRLRIINQNIFYLLKLLHINSALKNVDKLSSLYSKLLKEHPSTKELMNVDEAILKKYYHEHLVSLVAPISQAGNEEFKQRFKQSLIELSSFRPVIAYELGKTSYFEALNQEAVRILQDPSYTENQTQEYKDGFEKGVRAGQKHNFLLFEKKLIKAIKNLSFSTSILTNISCRYQILKIERKHKTKNMKAYLKTYFEETILPLMEQQHKS